MAGGSRGGGISGRGVEGPLDNDLNGCIGDSNMSGAAVDCIRVAKDEDETADSGRL